MFFLVRSKSLCTTNYLCKFSKKPSLILEKLSSRKITEIFFFEEKSFCFVFYNIAKGYHYSSKFECIVFFLIFRIKIRISSDTFGFLKLKRPTSTGWLKYNVTGLGRWPTEIHFQWSHRVKSSQIELALCRKKRAPRYF